LGQWALLLMSAVAAMVLAVRVGRARRAGFAALALLAKPQLFVWTALGLGIAALSDVRYRRFVIFALVIGGALVVASWLAYPDWFGAWSADIPARRTGRSAVLLSAFGQLFGMPGRVLAVAVPSRCANPRPPGAAGPDRLGARGGVHRQANENGYRRVVFLRG